MCLKVKWHLDLYICIILALINPSSCAKYLKYRTDQSGNNDLNLIKDFRRTFLEAFFVTLACLFTGYLLAGLPSQISWNKLIPTLLIGFPVYGTRFAAMTFGGNGIGEQMDKLFFKTLYVIGITWLAWDIFKGII